MFDKRYEDLTEEEKRNIDPAHIPDEDRETLEYLAGLEDHMGIYYERDWNERRSK